MAKSFRPKEQMAMYCRFCEKVSPAHLNRSIADNGRTLSRSGTYEYCCAKCLKTFCFSGNDLLEEGEGTEVEEQKPRTYTSKEHYYIGEVIYHETYEDTGLVVGKESSTTPVILVQFENTGMKKLVEDVA